MLYGIHVDLFFEHFCLLTLNFGKAYERHTLCQWFVLNK